MKLTINELIISMFVYLFAIYFHEFGHFLIAKLYGKLIEVRGLPIPEIIYYTEDKIEEVNILGFGIIFGLTILIVYGLYLYDNYKTNGIILFIIYFITYLLGCSYDIKQIISIK